MGLVLNKLIGSLTLPELLVQLEISASGLIGAPRIHFGGPVESGRGFVLHSADYTTATLEILRAIGRGEGPRKSLLALGYAGWGPGQLDSELQQNGWLHAPADDAIVFDAELESKWQRALGKLGVELSMLSGDAGHA